MTSVPHSNDALKDVSKLQLPETVTLNHSFAASAKENNNNFVPTAQVEKTNTKDEINNAFLSGATK